MVVVLLRCNYFHGVNEKFKSIRMMETSTSVFCFVECICVEVTNHLYSQIKKRVDILPLLIGM